LRQAAAVWELAGVITANATLPLGAFWSDTEKGRCLVWTVGGENPGALGRSRSGAVDGALNLVAASEKQAELGGGVELLLEKESGRGARDCISWEVLELLLGDLHHREVVQSHEGAEGLKGGLETGEEALDMLWDLGVVLRVHALEDLKILVEGEELCLEEGVHLDELVVEGGVEGGNTLLERNILGLRE